MAGALGFSADAGTTPNPQPTPAVLNQVANDPSILADPRMASYTSGVDGSRYAQQLDDYGNQIMPQGSILSQQSQLDQQRDQYAAQKKAQIQNAINILQASQRGQINLPLLAAAGAIGAPTHTGGFSEALSNATAAATPVIEQQRVRDLEAARLQGGLGVDSADVDVANNAAAQADFERRVQLANQAHSTAAIVGGRNYATDERGDAAKLRAQTAQNVANINAGAKVDVADISADKNTWVYMGADPNNPKQGVAFNRRYGTVNPTDLMDPQSTKGALPADIQRAQWEVKQGLAPDIQTAWTQITTGLAPKDFQTAVQSEYNSMMKNPLIDRSNPQAIEAQARANVIERQAAYQATRTGVAAPVTGDDGAGGSAPPPAAVPAPQQPTNPMNPRTRMGTPPAAPSAIGAPPPNPGSAEQAPAVKLRQATPEEIELTRSALAAGKPKNLVLQRLKDKGIAPPPNL